MLPIHNHPSAVNAAVYIIMPLLNKTNKSNYRFKSTSGTYNRQSKAHTLINKSSWYPVIVLLGGTVHRELYNYLCYSFAA
jgi:hypothetical protein